MVKKENISDSDCIIDCISHKTEGFVKSCNAKGFISIFIDNLIRKFRYDNNDNFTIQINGLGCFIEDDDIISFLIKNLNDLGFCIKIKGEEKRINYLNITCTNNTKKEEYKYQYHIQNLPSIIETSSRTDISTIGIIIMKIVAQTIFKHKTLYKALVFDLDDTLWCGTLAENGIEKIKENMQSETGVPFIEFMSFINVLAKELGIFIAICSMNDVEQVKYAIEKLDESIFPLKKQIDCLIANYNNKSDNIKEIAKYLSILPQDMIFVDDNQIIRDEVNEKIPSVFVPQWKNHSEIKTILIAGCFFERNELSINGQERRRQFKLLQNECKKNNLPELFVKIFDDKDHKEAIELYKKSNQFKFSQQNSSFGSETKSLYFELYRKDGESLGVCSAITFSNSNNGCNVYNWAISCRYFAIGLEEYVLMHLQEALNLSRVSFCYQKTHYNSKVDEFLLKYTDSIITNDMTIEFAFTQEAKDEISKNTNLKTIHNG